MRIAIVSNVPLAVEAVRRVLLGAPGHQVAWIAADGVQAVELCARDTPDLILMDLIMPRLGGVEATRRIMARHPCPIVVVTADINHNSSRVFEAMGAGALDAVNTPVLQVNGACQGAAALLAKIETIRKLVGVPAPGRTLLRHRHDRQAPVERPASLLAIGASAGGPAALAAILARLPADFPAPIVIVQHVDAQFVQGLADWLDHQTPLNVRLAREGDSPQPGVVLLAGRDQHLVLEPVPAARAPNPISARIGSPAPRRDGIRRTLRLAYTRLPANTAYRPSIDVFFSSLERFWPGDVIGVLLTGMGRDGAEGLQRLRARGHHTIVQDQSSSAVYGMPKAAAELQAASEILPLNQIAPRLLILTARKMALRA